MENLENWGFQYEFPTNDEDLDLEQGWEPVYDPKEDPFNMENFEVQYIHEDIETMWNDICRLHSEITDGTPGEHCVEIRPLMRKANIKGKHDIAIKNFHLWKANEEAKARFVAWINSDIRNQGCCLYISVYCFDSMLKSYKENGQPYRPFTINKHNQLYTRVMVVDLDDITADENARFDKTMDSLSIPFESVQTSENGFQKRFYLQDQVEDANALSVLAKILINKGFKVDPKVINRGQVVRLVGSVNNKVFSPKYKREFQFKVKVVRDTTEKIAFKDLINRIMGLSDCQYPKYKVSLSNIKEAVAIKKDNFKPIAYYDEDTFVEHYKDIIPEHYFNSIQKPIRFMLIDTADGYTDAVVMFIIPYFKNTLKLSFEQTKIIMDKWAELNGYNESDKYERIYYTDYKKGFGIYTTELQERYGSLVFNKNYDTIIKINDDTVNLKPNIFNKEIYPNLDKTALKVFIGFLFEYKASNKITWSISEVMEFNNISKPTAIKALKHLVEYDFISCLEKFKKRNDGNEYTLTKTYVALKTERRIEFSLSELDRMVSKLKGNEIKVFIYMKYIVLKSSDGLYYGNQDDIADELGADRSGISKILNSLKKKRFLNIDKIRTSDGFESNSYTLII